MNILHLISQKQEFSARLLKLKAACDDAFNGIDEASGTNVDEVDEEDGGEDNASTSASPGYCPYDREELQKRLDPTQFRVTQNKGTEK